MAVKIAGIVLVGIGVFLIFCPLLGKKSLCENLFSEKSDSKECEPRAKPVKKE